MPTFDQKVIDAASTERSEVKQEEDLRCLKRWLDTQRHLPYISDEFLLRFLHSCYYDVDRTEDCIEAYFSLRSNAPELLCNRDVTRPELVRASQVMYYAIMPKPDPRGYRIVCNSLRDPDPANYDYADANKLLTMTLEACYARYGLEAGLVIIHDMRGAKLAHLSKCSLSVMRKLTQYNQDASPVRLREIYILNTVSWIDKVLTLLKPFIKKELLNVFNFYTSDNTDQLYEKIPRECLPEEYGGTDKSLEVYHAENMKTLESIKHLLLEDEKAHIDASKRTKGKAKEYEVEETFRKLDID